MTIARTRAMPSSSAISCQIGSCCRRAPRRDGGGSVVPSCRSRSGTWGTRTSLSGDHRPEGQRRPRSARRQVVALLLDLGLLAAEVAQVVELRATHVTAGQDLDLVDDRGVQREGALHADAEGDLAHREGAAHARALDPDADALEHLDAGAVALDDLDVDLEGVAGTEVGDVVAAGGGGERVDDVGHEVSSWAPQVTRGTGGRSVVLTGPGSASCGAPPVAGGPPALPHEVGEAPGRNGSR